MIYFGWDGWSPLHSPLGSIWFCAGVLFVYVIVLFWNLWDDRHQLAPWGKILTFFFLMIATPSLLSGYYGWFMGAHTQAQKDRDSEYAGWPDHTKCAITYPHPPLQRSYYIGAYNPVRREDDVYECKHLKMESK